MAHRAAAWLPGLALFAAPALAQSPADSVYTDLDTDHCQVLSQVEEGESVSWLCPGFRTFPVYVNAGDGRFDVDVGIDDGAFDTIGQFNAPGPRVEWRLRDRAPFAIIYRLREVALDARGSTLFVETIGTASVPGCTVATVAGDVPQANQVARDLADSMAEDFRCGVDQPAVREAPVSAP
jgi:hypothetical protein